MTTTLQFADETTEAASARGPIVRVCHISVTLATGGLERLLADFARFHDRSRFDLQFIAMEVVGHFADEIRGCGCDVRMLSKKGRVSRVREMARLLRMTGADVVHTHNTTPHIYGTIAARIAGVPVVVNTRHGQRMGHGWRSRWEYRLASHGVDRIVGVSDDAMRLTVDGDGVRSDKVARIWNGIDVDRFAYRGPGPDAIGISVARLSAEKDIPTLLRAMKLAAPRVPELRLMIVGDGAQRAELEGNCRELGLRDHVQFLGERHDVPELLCRAGFYVCSSLSEGISLTLLEAMAVGLPIVATAAGGTPEVVDDRVTGLLVRVGDAEALAEAMVEMCQRKGEWQAMGKAGRRRVAEDFEVQRMVAEYEDLYEKLLASKQESVDAAAL